MSRANIERAAARVRVDLPSTPYEIVVGRGLSRDLEEISSLLDGAENAFVVSDEDLAGAAAERFDAMAVSGVSVHHLVLPGGEGSKSLESVGRLYEALAQADAHRHDVVVAFGGGVVTDVAGFVASTFNRGMPLINVPTTLLGQVDAAIGGKNGVNLRHAKNLVGTIYQPRAVICDVDLLTTLPRREVAGGLAEVVKYGFIADAGLLDIVEREATRLLEVDLDLIVDVIARCAAIKARVVEIDEKDSGVRAHLNYGHTFGHAIERSGSYGQVTHGEAVALGMVAAAYLAAEMDLLEDAPVERHHRVLAAVELPTRADLDLHALREAWRHDKKYRRGVRFVLLRSLPDGGFEPVAGIEAPEAAVARAIERLAG